VAGGDRRVPPRRVAGRRTIREAASRQRLVNLRYEHAVVTLTFLAFATVAVMIPGPDTAVVLAHSLQAKWAGIKASSGVVTGLLTHTLFATVGLSALITSAPLLFELLKCVGGLVLIGMGLSALVATARPTSRDDAHPTTPHSPWLSGYVVNFTNPKTWVVFLTVLPALLDARPSETAGATMLLAGGTLAGLAAVWYTTLAVTVARASERHARTRHPAVHLLLGGTLAGFGAASLISQFK
jgi:threonine/homoserine/homoserine lactone efflux protein